MSTFGRHDSLVCITGETFRTVFKEWYFQMMLWSVSPLPARASGTFAFIACTSLFFVRFDIIELSQLLPWVGKTPFLSQDETAISISDSPIIICY